MNTDVLRAEWIKVRSVRSTYYTLGVALGGILLGVAVAWSAVAAFDGAPPAMRATARVANLEEVVVLVPQLCLGILGVLAITSEYGTEMIATSLMAVPRRWPMLAAKACVLAAIGLVTGPLVVFGTYFASRSIIGDRFNGAYLTPVGDKVALLAVSGLSVVVFALLGLGLATVLRSTAGAIVIVVGLVYVVPMVAGNLPEPWSERLGSVMLPGLPRQIVGEANDHSVFGSLLSPAGAVAVLVAYALLPLAAGALLLRRRDA
ncbi:ABC transporter permease subunit [Sphaerisporangium perillae]|uniref:ABC transporter permease subunit n=1 Tax=Sphaerisporangium perillae TaxID=2935860 RepID=UPI00201035E3|nr:ABC transporter permease subunit [Sphaerisporangium perillae]